jgi:hypothetical protein
MNIQVEALNQRLAALNQRLPPTVHTFPTMYGVYLAEFGRNAGLKETTMQLIAKLAGFDLALPTTKDNIDHEASGSVTLDCATANDPFLRMVSKAEWTLAGDAYNSVPKSDHRPIAFRFILHFP